MTDLFVNLRTVYTLLRAVDRASRGKWNESVAQNATWILSSSCWITWLPAMTSALQLEKYASLFRWNPQLAALSSDQNISLEQKAFHPHFALDSDLLLARHEWLSPETETREAKHPYCPVTSAYGLKLGRVTGNSYTAAIYENKNLKTRNNADFFLKNMETCCYLKQCVALCVKCFSKS